ncbi:MAG: DNA-binding protein [Pseudomonadota bacterium]
MEDYPEPLTPQQARHWFEAAGVSISDWAQTNGFKRDLVYSLLAGRIRGSRGDAHRAAVALGLKRPPPKQVLTALRVQAMEGDLAASQH